MWRFFRLLFCIHRCGSADRHRMQDLQIPVTAVSRVPLAWIFAINQRQTHFLPWWPFSDSKENTQDQLPESTLPSQWSRPYLKERKEGGFRWRAGFFGSHRSWRQAPITSHSLPAQTHSPREPPLAASYHPSHWDQVLWRQAAHAQHGRLRRSIAGDHVLHVILLGVGGWYFHSSHFVSSEESRPWLAKEKKLALKLHAHSVHNAHKLVQTRRSLVHSPHLQTNQERSAGLSACNPPDPHWLLSSFLLKELFFPSGPFPYLMCGAFLLLA